MVPYLHWVYTDEFIGAQFLVDYSGEDTMVDALGHGTHVAGTIGSVTWGVAKKTTLFAVRVLDSGGSGTNSGVLAGMNYVIEDAPKRAEQCPNGFVAYMSLGGRKLKAMNDAVSCFIHSYGSHTDVPTGCCHRRIRHLLGCCRGQ
jgi:cerevisin